MKINNTLTHIYKIADFAMPISMGMLINMISGFVAMVLVAKLGRVELAAGALAIPTFITILTVFSTIFYALSILIGHYKAQEKPPLEIGQLIKNGFLLAIILSIPANLICWNIDKILLLFRQDQILVALTHRYFIYAGLAMIPTLLGSVMFQIFLSMGKPRVMMFVSLLTLPAMVLLSYGLILGKAGLPQMGLTGVSCASFIAQTLACIGIVIYMRNQQEIKDYAIFSGSPWPTWSLCKAIFSLGLPIGIQFGAELAALAVATYFMGYFGVVPLAASQISSQYSMLVVMVTLGISQAVSVLTSEAYGKNDFQLVKDYAIAAMIILLGIFIIVFGLFFLMPKQLIRVFVDIYNPINQDLIHLATQLLIIAAVWQLVDGARNLLSGSLRGMHDSKAPMHIGVSCLWLISLPICYLVAFNFHGGPIGLRLGFITGFVIAVVLLYMRIKNKLNLSEQSSYR